MDVHAQDQDSVSLIYSAWGVTSATEQANLMMEDPAKPDTGLGGFQIFNPLRGPFNVYLGSFGSANKSLVFSPLRPQNFDLGFHQFDPYLVKNEDIRYYHVHSPFTELGYVMGSAQEQKFHLGHYQNINPSLNIGLGFDKLVSEGLYNRQGTNYSKFQSSAWYSSSEHRYKFFINFSYQRAKVEENGGLKDDDLFDQDNLFSKNAALVELNAAQNRWTRREFHITQTMDIGPKTTWEKNDSVSLELVIPKLRLGHSFTMQNHDYVFDDKAPNSLYYPSIFYNAVHTLDSIKHIRYKNKVFVQILGSKGYQGDTLIRGKGFLELNLGVDIHEIFQEPTEPVKVDTSLESMYAGFRWMNKLPWGTRFLYGASGKYYLDGYRKEDYLAEGYLAYSVRGVRFIYSRTESLQAPSWISQRFESNHYKLDQQLKDEKVRHFEFKLEADSINLGLTVSFYTVENYIYWDTISMPVQSGVTLEATVLKFNKAFRWRNLHLHNTLGWQQVSGKVVRLPEFMGQHSLFYQNKIFKGALGFALGLDLYYLTDYRADAYMPVTGQFHLQEEGKVKGTAVVDAFLNVQIKRARMFLKSEYLNQGLWEKGYYAALAYPMPDRAIRFGVSWMFYD